MSDYSFILTVTEAAGAAPTRSVVDPEPITEPTVATCIVGSDPRCSLVLPGLSARHATVIRRGRHTYVRNDSGGTIVARGRPVPLGKEAPVTDETFELGPYRVVVEFQTKS